MRPGERCDSKWVMISESPIHGRGLYAKKDIPEAEYLIEYLGEKIDKDESDRRGWEQMDLAEETGEAAVYIFTLDDHWDIDGKIPENAARLINHSCDPNCEAQIWEEKEIWIVSLRAIKKGEELFFNYGFDLENYTDHPCKCDSANCVGYICGEDYWGQLEKKLAKKEVKRLKKVEAAAKKAAKAS